MSFEVVVDDLRGHASHLDGLMDRLGTALSAANTVSMDDSAYGLLCSFLPPIVNPMEQEGMDSIQAASDAVGTTAGNVRMAADQYEQTDQANSQPFIGTLADAPMAPLAPRIGTTRASSGYTPAESGYTPAESVHRSTPSMPVEPMRVDSTFTPAQEVHRSTPSMPVEPMRMNAPVEAHQARMVDNTMAPMQAARMDNMAPMQAARIADTAMAPMQAARMDNMAPMQMTRVETTVTPTQTTRVETTITPAEPLRRTSPGID